MVIELSELSRALQIISPFKAERYVMVVMNGFVSCRVFDVSPTPLTVKPYMIKSSLV